MRVVAFMILCAYSAGFSSGLKEGEQSETHLSTTPGIHDIEVEWEGRRTSQSLEQRMQEVKDFAVQDSVESNARKLQRKKKFRQVFVLNRCTEPVEATVAYYKKPVLKKALKTETYMLPVGQTQPQLVTKKLRGDSFFVLGSSSSFEWGEFFSPLCLSDNRCFEEVRAKKNKSKVTYFFSCGSDGNAFLSDKSDPTSVPTASPVMATANPVVATANPVVATANPVVATASPVMATASPVVSVQLTAREQEWLIAHNVRRQKYHAQYGVSYVPLRWSTDLARSAQQYAERLANGFPNCHIEHRFQGDSYGGENLALNKGTSNVIRTPDSVAKRWTEDEEFLPFGQNGHFSQVIWRGSKFVGCADIYKLVEEDNLPHCHIQVCRYMAPGNCNARTNTALFEKMVEDFSPCPPQCPADFSC